MKKQKTPDKKKKKHPVGTMVYTDYRVAILGKNINEIEQSVKKGVDTLDRIPKITIIDEEGKTKIKRIKDVGLVSTFGGLYYALCCLGLVFLKLCCLLLQEWRLFISDWYWLFLQQ